MTETPGPADLTCPSIHEALGLEPDSVLPPPGMTMDEVFTQMAAIYGADCDLKVGDRLRLEVDALVQFQTAYAGPFSGGGHGVVKAGAEFIVNMDPAPGAIGFPCRPVDSEGIENALVPVDERGDPLYSGFGVVFLKRDVGRHLTKLTFEA